MSFVFLPRLGLRTDVNVFKYVPKDKQPASLCKTPPKSLCPSSSSLSSTELYGLSIGRGSFSFHAGSWTHIKQTIWLNTVKGDLANGGFILEVDGNTVARSEEVYFRDVKTGLGDNSKPAGGKKGLLGSLWPLLPPLLGGGRPTPGKPKKVIGFTGIFFRYVHGGSFVC